MSSSVRVIKEALASLAHCTSSGLLSLAIEAVLDVSAQQTGCSRMYPWVFCLPLPWCFLRLNRHTLVRLLTQGDRLFPSRLLICPQGGHSCHCSEHSQAWKASLSSLTAEGPESVPLTFLRFSKTPHLPPVKDVFLKFMLS